MQRISFTAWWPHKGAGGLSLGSPSCNHSFGRRALMVSQWVINASHTNLKIQGSVPTFLISSKFTPTEMYCWDPPSTPALQNPSWGYNSKRVISSSNLFDLGATFLCSCSGGAGRGNPIFCHMSWELWSIGACQCPLGSSPGLW